MVSLKSQENPFMVSKTGARMFGGSCVGIDSSKLVVGSFYCMIASNSSMKSRSNHSNSLMESNSQDSSLIDLKLGRDQRSKKKKKSKAKRIKVSTHSDKRAQ
jgi:hypothetical protein